LRTSLAIYIYNFHIVKDFQSDLLHCRKTTRLESGNKGTVDATLSPPDNERAGDAGALKRIHRTGLHRSLRLTHRRTVADALP
jgi:hypothetical protein